MSEQADSVAPLVQALAPVTTVAALLGPVLGVATDNHGVLVTDPPRGTLISVLLDGQIRPIVSSLEWPREIVTNADGDIFVLERRGERIVRVARDGAISLVAAGLRRPRGLALDPEGNLWTMVLGDAGASLVRIDPAGTLTTVKSGFLDAGALAAGAMGIVVATPARVVRVPFDGGPVAVLLENWHAEALALDTAGDLYAAGQAPSPDVSRWRIVKYHSATGRVSRFAEGLGRIGALAFGQSGNLFVTEGQSGGRLLRFAAPPSPVVDVPAFTNKQRLEVAGFSEPGSRVQVLVDGVAVGVATADGVGGRFVMDVPLSRNAQALVSFLVTGAGGAGLMGTPMVRNVTHDDGLPSVGLVAPAAAAYVRDSVDVLATAHDAVSGLARMMLLVEDVVAVRRDAGGESSSDVRSRLPVSGLSEGSHTLTAVAEDRAGNTGAAAQLLVVDRTAPNTVISNQPTVNQVTRDAVFTVDAADNLSPVMEYAWRIDGEPWSSFQRDASVRIAALEPGTHVFEVKARDLAGNEDETPALFSFGVAALTLNVIEPAAGSTPAGTAIWVRGTVDGAAPVTVSVRLAPEFAAIAEHVSATAVGGHFAIQVPVGTNQAELSVSASDSTFATVTKTIPLQGLTTESGPERSIAAWPSVGFAPHTVLFGMAALPAGTYTVDLESDGMADYVGERPDSVEFTFAAPGAYLATLSTVDPAGVPRQWRSIVTVHDRALLEAELRAAWTGLKQSLAGGDVSGAASTVHSARRVTWLDAFSQQAPSAAQIEATLTDIDVVGIDGGRIECEMMRFVDGLMFSYPITFAIDRDGRWRLWQF